MKNWNSRGFTLHELMVAIVIVGILAAFIVPSYTEGVRKAKIAEFISLFSEIRVKEQQYYGESKEYLAISKDTWREELSKNFEITVIPRFFDYEVTVGPDGKTYEIIATLKQDLGRAKAGAQAKINQDGVKSFVNDIDNGLESYTNDWKNMVEK